MIARRDLFTGFGLMLVSAGCADGEPVGNELGATAPAFQLEDFQPQSARFGEVYGMEEFRGSVLLMPLFAAWCPDCVGCARLLNGLYQEWLAEGLNVRIMSINSVDGRSSRHKLVEACAFPLLQDTAEAGAWEKLRGGRDDHYVFTANGVLDRYYDYAAGQRVDPLSDAGKAALRDALLRAGA
jgi:peroxiredoxin